MSGRGHQIANFEIDEDESIGSEGQAPLSSGGITNPLPRITGGMKPSKLKRYSYLLLIFVPVTFYLMVSGLTVYQMSLMGSASISKFEDIRGVIDNAYETACSLKPITDFMLIKNDTTCPAEWEQATIGSWPGIRAGCFQRKDHSIKEGECSGGTTQDQLSVKARDPISFTIWKGHFICIKRMETFKRKDSTDCEKSEKLCFANPGYYCIPKENKCPISLIEKIPSKPETPEANTTYTSLKTIYGEEVIFRIRNDPEDVGTLADITTSLTSEPCLDPMLTPQRFSSRGYPYMDRAATGCGKYGVDADSRKIDNQPEESFNRDHGLHLHEFMPDTAVPHVENDKMNLIAKYEKVEIRHLGCNMCSPDFGWRLETGGEEIHILDKYYRRYSKIGSFLVFAMMCVLIFNVLVYWKNKDNLEYVNDKTWTVNLVMLGFLLGHYVTAGIFAFLSYLELSRAAVATDLMVQWRCFQNKNINRAMQDFHVDFIKTNLKVTVDGMVVIVIAILAVVLFMVADYVLHDIKAKESIKSNREDSEHRVRVTTGN